MKTSHAAALVAASVLITVAVEETRILSLRAKLESASNSSTPSAKAAKPAAPQAEAGTDSAPVRTKSQERPETAKAETKPADATPAGDELTSTVRKMWDNPAGKSMMNQGVKMVVGMMYQDLIDGMGLSKEESDYFKTLLGKEMAGQQELGMKLMSASPEERKALMDEQQAIAKQNEEDIRKFLNNEEDYKKYTDYKDHLPERQQLDGIRAAMTGKGAPLDAETESRLVDAMYKARTTSGAPDLSGAAGLDALKEGNITETFERTWDKQQDALNREVSGILNPEQMTAFAEHQKQMKEMQLMGLKMAEKMFPKVKEGESK
jgi:hypothetical protein